MCGRFAQVIKHDRLVRLSRELKLKETSEQVELNFNVAPTQTIAAIVNQDAVSYLGHFRWGLIPSWSRELPKYNLINVRSETILEKPSFRGGLARRRCIIPANGFYEWRQGDKQPFFIHAADDDLIYLAGIYDAWYGAEGSYIPSAAIITTSSNAKMSSLHQRMPVLLETGDLEQWLDGSNTDASGLLPMLKPAPDTAIDFYPVSKAVNKVENNTPLCLERIEI